MRKRLTASLAVAALAIAGTPAMASATTPASPSATPAAAPTAAPQGYYEPGCNFKTQRARENTTLRRKPTTKSDGLKLIKKGHHVRCLGYYYNGGKYDACNGKGWTTWIKVRYKKTTGYAVTLCLSHVD